MLASGPRIGRGSDLRERRRRILEALNVGLWSSCTAGHIYLFSQFNPEYAPYCSAVVDGHPDMVFQLHDPY